MNQGENKNRLTGWNRLGLVLVYVIGILSAIGIVSLGPSLLGNEAYKVGLLGTSAGIINLGEGVGQDVISLEFKEPLSSDALVTAVCINIDEGAAFESTLIVFREGREIYVRNDAEGHRIKLDEATAGDRFDLKPQNYVNSQGRVFCRIDVLN